MKTEQNDKNKFADLFKLINTEDDRKEILEFCSTLKEAVFETVESLKNRINSNNKFGPMFLNLLELKDNKDAQTALITEVANTVKALPSVEVQIAIEPTPKILNFIASLAAQHKEKRIFSIIVKPEIVGGAIVISDGVYHDFSLEGKLKKAFEDRANDIKAAIT